MKSVPEARAQTIYSKEPITELIMKYFYEGGKKTRIEDLYNKLKPGREWLRLARFRGAWSSLMRQSPDTLSRCGGCRNSGFIYTYTGIPYRGKVKTKQKSCEKARKRQRQDDSALRQSLISGKWGAPNVG